MWTSEKQRDGFEAFAREAAIPALNRLEIAPVGVFYPQKELSPDLRAHAAQDRRVGDDMSYSD